MEKKMVVDDGISFETIPGCSIFICDECGVEMFRASWRTVDGKHYCMGCDPERESNEEKTCENI